MAREAVAGRAATDRRYCAARAGAAPADWSMTSTALPMRQLPRRTAVLSFASIPTTKKLRQNSSWQSEIRIISYSMVRIGPST